MCVTVESLKRGKKSSANIKMEVNTLKSELMKEGT